MSPEEYVARHSHEYVLAGPLGYRYDDPAFDAWIGAVADLLHDRTSVVRLRQQHLSPSEIQAAERYENDPLRPTANVQLWQAGRGFSRW
jgi:hypothetical protein